MLVGGKWFWCCKDNIIFPLRRHRTARVFPTRRAFSVRPPHSARWAAPNCAFLPYPFTSSAPFFSFLLLFSSTSRYEEANIGKFRRKVPCFSSKVPHFRAFSPVFCRVPRPAHPPCAIRCIFLPHLRSAKGVKRTSSIYSCTTSSDAGVPFPFRCHKVQSFLTTMRPSPRLLASFAFKILLQLVHSLLTRPTSPIVSSANFLSPWSSTRLFPHLSETHLRDMTQKLTIRTINRRLSSHFAIQILPLSCKIRRTLQKCEEKAWRIGIKALALPKDDRKLGCLNVNNVQSAVRNRQNRLSPDPQA